MDTFVSATAGGYTRYDTAAHWRVLAEDSSDERVAF